MTIDVITTTDMVLSNSILIWMGLRLIKRVDDLDRRVDKHETRIQLTERSLYGSQEAKND